MTDIFMNAELAPWLVWIFVVAVIVAFVLFEIPNPPTVRVTFRPKVPKLNSTEERKWMEIREERSR